MHKNVIIFFEKVAEHVLCFGLNIFQTLAQWNFYIPNIIFNTSTTYPGKVTWTKCLSRRNTASR